MKRRVLTLGLILLFQDLLFAAEVYNLGRGHYYQRPYYHRPRYIHPQRINTLRGGTLTGFSPPVTGSYYTSPSNANIGVNIKRFFDQRFNNHYANSPYYNTYSYDSYINNDTKTLFSTPKSNIYYNNPNDYDINGDNPFNTETKVTIID